MTLANYPIWRRRRAIWLTVAVAMFVGACGPRLRIVVAPDVPPEHLWSPPLVYPRALRQAGREGTVVLVGAVDATGRIVRGSVRVLRSSNVAFEAPAIAMLYGSRFRPAREDGRPVEALVQMPVNFEIQGDGTVTSADSAAADSVFAQARLLVREGRIPAAMNAFSRAQTLDSRVAEVGAFWQPLCWYGSLWGYPNEVMSACDRLVSLAPNRIDYRDARGVARTLAWNLEGAIADFEVVAERTLSERQRTDRLAWIADLRRGRNPLTPEVVRDLRSRGSL